MASTVNIENALAAANILYTTLVSTSAWLLTVRIGPWQPSVSAYITFCQTEALSLISTLEAAIAAES